MAKRKRGGQPGNKNAKGHRGANRYSPGARTASDRQRAARARSASQRVRAPLGTRLRGTVRGQALYVKRNRRKFAKAAAKGAVNAVGGIALGLTAATAANIAISSRGKRF